MKMIVLGTGNAVVTKCYNTCFALTEGEEIFLVDGGGGNTILSRLKEAGLDWKNISTVFVTHKHMDHILGILWILRMFCQGLARGQYQGRPVIYANQEVARLLKEMAGSLLGKKEAAYLGREVKILPVEDGDKVQILGREVTFFDIRSTKADQFGFSIRLDQDRKLTCCGDEPYNPAEEPYAKGSAWLLHEAFCLYSQADRFKPYEKNHSTARDAARLARELGVENLVLYHTEDQNLEQRQKLYTAEAREEFSGNIYVPYDLDVLEL